MWIIGAFNTVSMLDYPYPTDFGSSLPAAPVNVTCEEMLKNVRGLIDFIYVSRMD